MSFGKFKAVILMLIFSLATMFAMPSHAAVIAAAPMHTMTVSLDKVTDNHSVVNHHQAMERYSKHTLKHCCVMREDHEALTTGFNYSQRNYYNYRYAYMGTGGIRFVTGVIA